MAITQFLAALPVRDIDASARWYERLLGQPATDRPMANVAEWHLPTGSSLQLVADNQRTGSGLLTIGVDDVSAFVTAARDRGVVIGEISPGEMVSFVTVADPDGNTITVAQSNTTGA